MAKNRRKNKKLKKLLKPANIFLITINLLVLILVIFYLLIINNPKQSIFPVLDQYQSSSILATTLPLPEVIEHGPRNKKEVALTFDADMTYGMLNLLKNGSVKSWYNKPVIDYLDKEKVAATIFITGLGVKAYPSQSKDIAKNSLFEIGNHSYSHPAFNSNCFGLPLLSRSDENEVKNAQNEIIKATGVVPELFRFPGGCYKKTDLETISRLGLKIVHWDTVGGDGFNNNTDAIVNNIKKGVQNGSIIVLHLNDGSLAPKTYDAILQIVPI